MGLKKFGKKIAKKVKGGWGRFKKKVKKATKRKSRGWKVKGWGRIKKHVKKVIKRVKAHKKHTKGKLKKALKRGWGRFKKMKKVHRKGWGKLKKFGKKIAKKVIKRVKAHKHGFKHWMNKLKKLKFKKAPARKCAREHARNGGNVCKCHGLVTYGARGKFSRKHVRGQITCNNANFGDPIHGVVKDCFCQSKARRMHKRRRL